MIFSLANASPAFVPGLIATVGIYLALGVLFAIPFAMRGVNRLDPAARAGTWGFRVLIVPGVVLLWPAMLARWIKSLRAASNPHPEHTP